MDAAFVLDLVTVIRGQDKKGQEFEMAALLAGRGKLVVFYDRDGIVYRNERLARDFRFASRVEFETPAAGVLENVQGLCAKVLLFGCVRVRSIVKVGETIEVQGRDLHLEDAPEADPGSGGAIQPRAGSSRVEYASSWHDSPLIRFTDAGPSESAPLRPVVDHSSRPRKEPTT